MSPEFALLKSAYREAAHRLGVNHPFTQTWRSTMRSIIAGCRETIARRSIAPVGWYRYPND